MGKLRFQPFKWFIKDHGSVMVNCKEKKKKKKKTLKFLLSWKAFPISWCLYLSFQKEMQSISSPLESGLDLSWKCGKSDITWLPGLGLKRPHHFGFCPLKHYLKTTMKGSWPSLLEDEKPCGAELRHHSQQTASLPRYEWANLGLSSSAIYAAECNCTDEPRWNQQRNRSPTMQGHGK